MRKILQKIFLPNQYGWILLLFSVILIPTGVAVALLSDLQSSLMMKMAYIVFSFFLLFIPALFLPLRYYFLLEGVFVVLAPLEITHILLNKMPVSEGFVMAVFSTDAGEAFELLSSFKGICLLALLVWSGYFFVAFTRIRNNYLFTRKAGLLIGGLFILFNILLYSSMLWMGYRGGTMDYIGYANENFQKKYRKIYPYDLFTVSFHAFENRREAKKMQQQISSFSFGAIPTANPKGRSEKELFVVVIGESARFGNFSLNGYSRPTSPELEKMEGLLSYTNVYATANLTEIVLPLLLTRATPLDPETGYKEKAFTDAFAESGFQTAWIANQSAQNPFIKRIAEDTHYHHFSLTDFDASSNYDGKLLPQLDSVLQLNNSRQLIVLHTLGSHFRYNFRYPEAFRKFTPAMEGTVSYSVLSPSNKELLVNSYDNAIGYTDHFLASVINKIKQQNTVSAVLYLSDHAENLYDDENELILHGGGKPSAFEIHVPLLLWTSEHYRTTYPEKQTELAANTDRALSSSNLFHTLLDMADIHYPDEKLTASFASPLFREDSIRYVLMPDKQVIYFPKQKRDD